MTANIFILSDRSPSKIEYFRPHYKSVIYIYIYIRIVDVANGSTKTVIKESDNFLGSFLFWEIKRWLVVGIGAE